MELGKYTPVYLTACVHQNYLQVLNLCGRGNTDWGPKKDSVPKMGQWDRATVDFVPSYVKPLSCEQSWLEVQQQDGC